MTDRPFDADDLPTEYDDVPAASAYDPDTDDRSFGWEDEVTPRHSGGRGGGARFASRQRSRLPRLLLGIAVVVLLVGAGVGVWVQRKINPPGSPGAVQTVVIPSGSSTSAIGHLLADDGVISSSFVWDWYVRINGGGPFEAGSYQLATKSSMGDIVEELAAGPTAPPTRRVTVPEGFTVAQTLARLADPSKGLGLSLAKLQQVLASGAVRSTFQPAGQTSSEGILFPDTYEFDPKKMTEQSVLQTMADEMDSTLTQLDVTSAETSLHLSPYEILTVASLIEEETKVPSERPMVARVIYNRIKQGIPLGIDATSRYEAVMAGRDRSQVDFTSASPYNTRRFKGLPPTPIAAPGRASLEAALHPADGDWIFYVLQDTAGHHLFTASNTEFLAKQRCHDAGLGSEMTRVAGVMGSPIAHSLSPAIFTAAFEAAGLDWTYRAFEVGEAEAADFMAEVRSGRIHGLSVTMPDKAAVIPALDHLSPVAADLGAVNCVARLGDDLWGHNTDGAGLLDSLRLDEGIEVAGLTSAVVGAGGAGRAVARALGEAGATVVVVNRTPERAAEAAALAGPLGTVGLEADVGRADLVVNTTPVGMGDDDHLPVPALLLRAEQIVVDIVYHPMVTPLLAAAAAVGARTVGGLGMLVHQAGHAYRHWTGEEPPIDAMRAGAVAALAAREVA